MVDHFKFGHEHRHYSNKIFVNVDFQHVGVTFEAKVITLTFNRIGGRFLNN